MKFFKAVLSNASTKTTTGSAVPLRFTELYSLLQLIWLWSFGLLYSSLLLFICPLFSLISLMITLPFFSGDSLFWWPVMGWGISQVMCVTKKTKKKQPQNELRSYLARKTRQQNREVRSTSQAFSQQSQLLTIAAFHHSSTANVSTCSCEFQGKYSGKLGQKLARYKRQRKESQSQFQIIQLA